MHGSVTRHSRSSAEMFDGEVSQKHEEVFLQGVDKGAVHLCKREVITWNSFVRFTCEDALFVLLLMVMMLLMLLLLQDGAGH